MKWLPWLAAGAAALFLLSYCTKGSDTAKQEADNAKAKAAAAAAAPTATVTAVAAGADAAKAAADAAAKATADAAAKVTADAAAAAKSTADAEAAAKATADAAAKAAADATPAPAGAGVVNYTAGGLPALKVYFNSGKVDVASAFDARSKDVVDYLKANATAKAVVTGFNDPTGNAAANAELAKNRAKNVVAALKAAGFADDRVVSEKPSDPTAGASKSNAEARRVEVTIRK
jgi:outer membrane protein OmpA-like peptidoglycan-associated protein